MDEKVTIIGAGLAGCEAAIALAKSGIKVKLIEMKPQKFTPVHKTANFSELVCSNSLKSKRLETASGLLKEEMKILDSIVIEAALKTSVPAGDALAVDRYAFSEYITKKIKNHPLIEIVEQEQKKLPIEGICIVATGPLTSDKLANELEYFLNKDSLNFFDAAAPIIMGDSIDYSKVFWASRYNKGGADYLNCCLTKEEYDVFWQELINAETIELKEFEKKELKVFSGCMPVEVMAKRGYETLTFGPLKPVGITNPNSEKKPYAVVQLRKENEEGTMFNMVGFQTNLKWKEQKRIFGLIPGLKNAEFARYGVMHRNTYINSPTILDNCLRCTKNSNIFFVGQITGVEGYLESAATGLFVGTNLANMLNGGTLIPLSIKTMTGALINYVSDNGNSCNFQPMNSNMGILPPLTIKIKNKQERYNTLAEIAIKEMIDWKVKNKV